MSRKSLESDNCILVCDGEEEGSWGGFASLYLETRFFDFFPPGSKRELAGHSEVGILHPPTDRRRRFSRCLAVWWTWENLFTVVHRGSPRSPLSGCQRWRGCLADEDCWVHGYEHQKTQLSLFLSINFRTKDPKAEILFKDFVSALLLPRSSLKDGLGLPPRPSTNIRVYPPSPKHNNTWVADKNSQV